MSSIKTTEVLNHQEVLDRIKRIAWQIYENHSHGGELIIAGIELRGYILAEKIVKVLEEISPIQCSLHKIKLNKRNLLNGGLEIDPITSSLEDKCIIVVDDVLNSGGTLIYGVKYFLEFDVKEIKTVVLVDRNHKRFPVKADFKGLSLSTSMMEHVDVNIEKEPFSVQIS